MICNISVFLGIVLVLLALSFMAKKYMSNTAKYSFQSWEKSDLPFITIDVQGHKLNMIADSAAAVSIIRKGILKDLIYEPNSRIVHLEALTEEGVNSQVVAIPININGKEIKTDFLVYASDDIACFRKHGIIMDGILGVEFFKATKGMIDFHNQTVKFP
jgi:hypothetical protein